MLNGVNGSLEMRLKAVEKTHQQLSTTEQDSYLVQSALGLAQLHKLKRRHNDVKPDNMVIGTRNTLMIVDMGSVSKIDGEGKRGTRFYEDSLYYEELRVARKTQQDLKALPYAEAIDVYSWSVTAYRVLSGLALPTYLRSPNSDPKIDRPPYGANCRFAELFNSCSRVDRSERPTFIDIVQTILANTHPSVIDMVNYWLPDILEPIRLQITEFLQHNHQKASPE